MCKESHVVLRSPEKYNTRYFSKTGSYSSQKDYSTLYRVGQNKLPTYILLFIALLYLFTFTNNIPCELKLCVRHIEAQTKLVC